MWSTTVSAALAPGNRSRTVALALCGLCILLGITWRFWDLAYPAAFTFDEHHFVENARNYLRGVADWNDHPPLAKLLQAVTIRLAGDGGLGWRLSAAVLGTAHLYFVYVAAAALFGQRSTGLLAAALVAIDGLFISYSRTALLDIPMNALMMAAVALMLSGRHLGLFAGAAVAIGLAVSVKWIAVCLAPLVPLLLWRQKRSVLHALWMGALAVAVYAGITALALAITHQPVSLRGMVRTSAALLAHHAGFTDWRNPLDSRWYTWPFLHRPFVTHRELLPGGQVRLTSTVGNPLLWYLTTAAFALSAVEVGRGLWWRWQRRRERLPAEPLRPQLWAQGFLLLGAVVLILQWIFSNRESYIWHYMGSYAFGLILLAGRFAPLWREQAGRVLALVAGVLAVSIFYSPVWTNGLLSQAAARWRLFLPAWW